MRKITTVLGIGVVFCALLGSSFVGTRPSYAGFDCESDRFNAVLAADANYTSAFRLWYRNDPTTCAQHCTSQCANAPSPTACYDSCTASCPNERYQGYVSAGDALAAAGSTPCAYNPDYCAQARANRDQCLATRNAQWENPMYDENGNIDMNWQMYVSNEYMACYGASGMDNCE